jgi:uncharacterized protein YgbK (DUF1537 family)
MFGAVADDLTGGLELAAMLCAGGVACDFVTAPEAATETEAQAIVIAQRTRVAPAEQAALAFEAAGRRLQALGARQLFFKYCATFDSTPAGNIGPCADVLHHLSGAQLTGFCPAFPEVGRRVFQGHLFVDDALVSESPKRHDPLTPMTDPNLVRVLARQTATAVGLVPQQVLHDGPAAAEHHCDGLRQKGVGFAIVDAATPEDLQVVAALTVSWPLMTGNSSVAAYYPALWRERGWISGPAAPAKMPPVNGPGIVLAGSCAERTLRQLELFGRERPVLMLDPAESDDTKDLVEKAVRWALPQLGEGPVAIATSAPPEEVSKAQAKLGQAGAARRAEEILSQVALRLREAGASRFLVAGGETSGAVIEALSVSRLTVGPYRAPGISHAVTPGASPIAFCLKSGKLGAEDMFLPMLAEMVAGNG